MTMNERSTALGLTCILSGFFFALFASVLSYNKVRMKRKLNTKMKKKSVIDVWSDAKKQVTNLKQWRYLFVFSLFVTDLNKTIESIKGFPGTSPMNMKILVNYLFCPIDQSTNSSIDQRENNQYEPTQLVIGSHNMYPHNNNNATR